MSYSELGYHIVFATKDRRPSIPAEVMPRLSEYIGGIIREMEGQMLTANGCADHVHVAAIASPKSAPMDFIKTIKCNSSRWLHQTFRDMGGFAWQEGYGLFSVSHSALPDVIGYVRRQQEHHAKMTFREEFIALLKKHGIEYDERYV
jgi:putative transposase